MYWLKSFSAFASVALLLFMHPSADCGATNDNYDNYEYVDTKRNTWWSKKSQPVEEVDDDPIISQSQMVDQNIVSSLACYVNGCVPIFASCVRFVDSKDHALGCQKQHRECGLWCFRQFKQLADIASDF